MRTLLILSAVLLNSGCALDEDALVLVHSYTPGLNGSPLAGATVGLSYPSGRVEWRTSDSLGTVRYAQSDWLPSPTQALVCAPGRRAVVLDIGGQSGHGTLLWPADTLHSVREMGWRGDVPDACGRTDASPTKPSLVE